MSAGAYAGPRSCPNCNYPIPPGSTTQCPICQHRLTVNDKDDKTNPRQPPEVRDPDDTLISSTPLVPAYLRRTPGETGPPSRPERPLAARSPSRPPPSAAPKRPWVTAVVVALSLVLAVALGYVAFRVARPIVGPSVELTANPNTPEPTASSSPTDDPSSTGEPSPTDEPTTEPELKRVKNVTAKASSTLPPDNYTYVVENTLDRDPVTAWNSDGAVVGELAKGVKLTYRFSKPVQLQEIEIYNGYQRSEQTFAANGRVRRLLISTDATEQSFELKDKDGRQTITHDFGQTGKVVLRIEAVYRDENTQYKDVAISDVTFFRI